MSLNCVPVNAPTRDQPLVYPAGVLPRDFSPQLCGPLPHPHATSPGAGSLGLLSQALFRASPPDGKGQGTGGERWGPWTAGMHSFTHSVSAGQLVCFPPGRAALASPCSLIEPSARTWSSVPKTPSCLPPQGLCMCCPLDRHAIPFTC